MQNKIPILRITLICTLFVLSTLAPAFSSPVPILSSDGLEELNLFTETAYAITNQETGIMPCSSTNHIGSAPPDLLNPNHWWKIIPSRSFFDKKPTYELINYGNITSGCAMGRKMVFYPASYLGNDTSDNSYFISTEHCRNVKMCIGKGDIYNGALQLAQESQTVHFCGNLNFTCLSPQSYRHSSILQEQLTIQSSSSNPITLISSYYKFQFLEYSPLLMENYDIVGSVQDFVVEDTTKITEEFKKPFKQTQEMVQGWRIGFGDKISNCANFQQEKQVGVEFKSIESSRLEFSQESLTMVRKMSKYSVSVGASITAPLVKFSPSIAMTTRVAWDSQTQTVSRGAETKLNEVTKEVNYEYISRVTIPAWKVAKVSTFLNVIKNLPIKWEANAMITVVKVGDGSDESSRMDCLGEEKIRKILQLNGYNLQDANWNETQQAFQFPFGGYIIVSYGMESYVQVSDEECPTKNQENRTRFGGY